VTWQAGVITAGAVSSVALSGVAYVQPRRAFPDRAALYLGEALVAAVGATAVAALRGHGPMLWATAPAFVAAAGLVAGKGSIPVLIHEGEDGEAVLVETARARTRFAVILVLAFVVLAVVVFASD
jgi:hypothetical protein